VVGLRATPADPALVLRRDRLVAGVPRRTEIWDRPAPGKVAALKPARLAPVSERDQVIDVRLELGLAGMIRRQNLRVCVDARQDLEREVGRGGPDELRELVFVRDVVDMLEDRHIEEITVNRGEQGPRLGAVSSLRRALFGVYLEVRIVPVLMWSFTAITLGTGLAAADSADVSVLGYLAAVAVGALLQGLVAHGVNEIIDWDSGTDTDPAPRTISGGSKVMAAGLLGRRGLVLMAAGGAIAATAIGLLATARFGLILLPFGIVGLVGAIIYTLPPLRAAYRPVVGETVAFVCIWACVAGAYALQTSTVTLGVAIVAAAYALACLSMLALHHLLDRGPDLQATPPKRTTPAILGRRATDYALGLGGVSLVLAIIGAVAVDPALAALAIGVGLSLVLQWRVVPDDADQVTKVELGVILTTMAGGLAAAGLMWPPLWLAAVAAAVLVPPDVVLAGKAAQSAHVANVARVNRG
jgi:1,4-dihydroxy-2-naphthoate octaprenyltransferase